VVQLINMRAVGELIRDVRTRRKIGRSTLEKKTKIKSEFIEALELSNWQALPEFPVTSGFVKSICSYLRIDQGKALALLRRDFPQKDLKINPKPDGIQRLFWTPSTTIFFGVVLALFGFLSYLFYQYTSFVRPPEIIIDSPSDNEVVKGENVLVKGRVDSNVSLVINNQPVFVGEDGAFETNISVYEGTESLQFAAKSRSGKETIVVRKIKVLLE